mmetsp:Transcript_24820/g.61637  ORF Transcript_24820/g.61637 Transcript_24820/m.61637 type:complete len:86 (-) Transcript_24820:395-652(-)
MDGGLSGSEEGLEDGDGEEGCDGLRPEVSEDGDSEAASRSSSRPATCTWAPVDPHTSDASDASDDEADPSTYFVLSEGRLGSRRV